MDKMIVVLMIISTVFFIYVFFSSLRESPRRKSFKTPDTNYPVALRLVSTQKYDYNDIIGRFNFASAKIYPAQGNYNITYINRNGITTHRSISASRVYENNGRFVVDGYCHLRAGRRSFSDHRIIRAVDSQTGAFINSVARHSISNFAESDISETWKAIDHEMMALYLLGFVGCTDYRIIEEKLGLIADYLKRRRPDLVIDDSKLNLILKRLGIPDPRQFKKIVSDMKAAGDYGQLRDITDCARRIVATQKTIDPLGKAVIEILETAIC